MLKFYYLYDINFATFLLPDFCFSWYFLSLIQTSLPLLELLRYCNHEFFDVYIKRNKIQFQASVSNLENIKSEFPFIQVTESHSNPLLHTT